ncbi:MAG: hypothetical protein HY744_20590 [Deltaproteobacteria bacterium]|nr:hypothetical protein [Deltaproteobacteria bacterium]
MSARARFPLGLPAGPGVLAAMFLYRSLASLLLGLPVALSVAPTVAGYPRGDAVLWDRGGVLLAEAMRRLDATAEGLGWLTGALALCVTFAGLLPLAALIAALGRGPAAPSPAREVLGQAGRRLGTLALMLLLTLLAQAAAAFVAVLCARLLAGALDLGPMARDLVVAGGALGGLGLGWALAIVQDAARVAAVQHDRGLFGAVGLGIGALRGRPAVALAAFLGRKLLALAVLALAGALAIAIGWPDPTRYALVVALQHVAVLAAVLLHASWLGWATARVRGELAARMGQD